jgi:hypothetical protein
MFGIKNTDKDNTIKKVITRKYKNSRITILDAKFKIVDDKEVMLDENQVDKLFMEINKAVESNSSKHNPSDKRILIANDEDIIENLLNKSNSEEPKESIFK